MSEGLEKSPKTENGAERRESETMAVPIPPPPPPDGGWGWMVVFASFMIHIVTDGMTYSFGVFYVVFLEYFQEGSAYTAWIVSILVGVTLCSGPISSSFVNRWGCRSVTIAGALLAAISVMISAFAQNVMTLIFTIGIGTGLGFGLIYLPAIVSVTVWFERYRSLATGIAVCGSGFGTFIFAPLTNILIYQYGWRGAMLIIGALVLNCIVFGIMFRPVPELRKSIPSKPIYDTKKSILKRSQSSEHMEQGNGKIENGDTARLTLSQPALNGNNEIRRSGSGLMLKPDVLYQGSMASLAHHRTPSPANYHDPEREAEISCDCLPCAKESTVALSEMLGLSLLFDEIFVLFSVSNFLTSVGFYVPYVYLVAHAKKLDIVNIDPTYLLSVVGVANSIGRIVLGYISDKPGVNRLFVYNLCLTICGLATVASMWATGFWGLSFYAAVFGFTVGAYVGLTSVVLVDLLGIAKLTNAFGLLLLFQGIASLLGPPFGGFLYDEFNSYKPAFYVAGVCIALSGVMLFVIPPVQRRRERRRRRQGVLDLHPM